MFYRTDLRFQFKIPSSWQPQNLPQADGEHAIRGMLAHLTYGGRTYELAAYIAADAFGSYQHAFERAIASFGPVTERRVLSVQPARMLDRAMTLAEFGRAHPAAVPLRELAILIHAVLNCA